MKSLLVDRLGEFYSALGCKWAFQKNTETVLGVRTQLVLENILHIPLSVNGVWVSREVNKNNLLGGQFLIFLPKIRENK